MGSCQCGTNSAKEVTDFPIPQADPNGSLSDYILHQPPLGSGAFGVVWKATHKASKQVRAIKQILCNQATQEDLEGIKNEIAILRNIDHPNIIKILDFFQESSSFYIVTELCTGGELFDRIVDSGSFSESDAAKVMKQILFALNYCHAQKLIHRDIKPENLLYESTHSDSMLKVIDFGTSKRTEGTRQREVVGTLYYMAPELLNEDYDEKCDIWSAGVVLYILLSGAPPFDGKDDTEIEKKIRQGDYNFQSRNWVCVSPEAKNFIRRMLEKNPKNRLSAEEALQDEWIVKYASDNVNAPVLENILTSMKQFRTQQRLQEATFLYIVKQFATKEEKEELLKTFKALDKNSDGVLTKAELMEGYKRFMSEADAHIQVDEIMKQVDNNQSGIIDYSEFVAATINRKKLLSQERLEAAFKVIDRDNSGSISVEELKQLFGDSSKIPKEAWNQMLQEVDENGDGQLSLSEFKDMMLKLTVY